MYVVKGILEYIKLEKRTNVDYKAYALCTYYLRFLYYRSTFIFSEMNETLNLLNKRREYLRNTSTIKTRNLNESNWSFEVVARKFTLTKI